MFLQQKPIPGYWYSNQSGQLIQVRAIVFSGGRGNRIVIEVGNPNVQRVQAVVGWIVADGGTGKNGVSDLTVYHKIVDACYGDRR